MPLEETFLISRQYITNRTRRRPSPEKSENSHQKRGNGLFGARFGVLNTHKLYIRGVVLICFCSRDSLYYGDKDIGKHTRRNRSFCFHTIPNVVFRICKCKFVHLVEYLERNGQLDRRNGENNDVSCSATFQMSKVSVGPVKIIFE